MKSTGTNRKLLRMSRIRPKKQDEELDSVKVHKELSDRRAFDILIEAQHYWNMMEKYRRDRERNYRYVYGDQWGDYINVDGKRMTEEDYIKSQGNIPLKNNLITNIVRRVLGVYRSQNKEMTCVARDRDEQELCETMSTVLQYNHQKNMLKEMDASEMREYMIGGLAIQRKCWATEGDDDDAFTYNVNPNMFIVDNNMSDPRTWDCSFVGEIHDLTFGQLTRHFAHSSEDVRKLREIYNQAADRRYVSSYAKEFGRNKMHNYDFLLTTEPGLCRVIEVWRKEQKPRIRCWDFQKGELFKIEVEDYATEVEAVNEERLALARENGIPEEEVPLITADASEAEGCGWFMDDYWYHYMLSPFGNILEEGETQYDHKSHPYVFRGYPFIDGEIHSFVSDFIDQQRYVNRLVTLYDWIMRASAKGVLMFPEDCKPEGMAMEDIAEEWTSFNGMIIYKPSKSGNVPQQISNNSTKIGITELLNIQLKFLEDISGVTQALQGKPGFAGESASHSTLMTENATKSLLDLLESFSSFLEQGAYKDVSIIQQHYDSKRTVSIAGKTVVYDPERMGNVHYDMSMAEMTNTPVYRDYQNEMLMELWRAQAISVEQLLENGSFPGADKLLQSIKAQRAQLEQGQIPEGISPQLLQQAQQGADMNAVNQLAA